MEEQQRQRVEQRKKADALIRRMDHFERAKREVEAPLLLEAYQERLKVGLCTSLCLGKAYGILLTCCTLLHCT